MKDFSSMEEWIAALREENVPIIVEGPNDKLALEQYDIQDIITLSKYPLYKVVDDITERAKRVIILTDLDKEGKQLYSKLKQSFDRVGVKVDTTYREWLFRESQLSHIEGLVTYMKHEALRKARR